MGKLPAGSSIMRAPAKILIAVPLLVCLVVVTFLSVKAQLHPSKETQVKAVFLYNFAQFAKWPDDKFPHPSSPLVIGIFGDDPFGPLLDEIVRGEKINERPIEIRRLSTPEQGKSCHLVFVDDSAADRLSKIIQILKGQNVITVSDVNDFTLRGGMIKFFIEENKMRFEVNMSEYKSSEVVLSSRLLRLAKICCN